VIVIDLPFLELVTVCHVSSLHKLSYGQIEEYYDPKVEAFRTCLPGVSNWRCDWFMRITSSTVIQI